MNKIKKFLRDIFAPRVTIHNYKSTWSSSQPKEFKKMAKEMRKSMEEMFDEIEKN